MKQGPDEQANTPLEDALLNLPQEEAPAGLQASCLAALDQATPVPAPRPHWEAWRQLAAAAAVIVMLVGVSNLMTTGSREKGRRPEAARLNMTEGPRALGGPGEPGAPGAAMAPPPPAAAAAPSAKTVSALEMKPSAGAPPDKYTPVLAMTPIWYDQSDQRRKVTQREVEVETPAVEETYKQAVSLIEKAGGYLTQEELVVVDRGRDHARLQARVPVEQFDGVIAQLRELGHLVRMTGQSEDKTEEYQAQGAGIGELGAREEALTAAYERESNRAKKEQLRQELQRVRGQLAADKASLKSLHKQTSWAQLGLEINETRGVRQIITRAAQEALPLAFNLALIAVPLLVLALLWKRRP